MTEEVAGFTKKQREFFLDAYGHQCAFHWKQNGKWIRCKNTKRLEVHHIYPRGWCRVNMSRRFPVNGIQQGIVLCRHHHWWVHPDMSPAMQEYRRGNKQAIKQMMERRKELNQKGKPYWNTQWDLLFLRLNKRFVGRYTQRTKRKYPQNGNRYANGRVRKR